MTAVEQTSFLFGTPKASPPEPPPPAARRNIVIEAGAGTGKTTAIVAEVLSLLLGDEELPAERIVLVTFTEKAAGEIADRIHEGLADLELSLRNTPAGERVEWPIGSSRPLLQVAAERRDTALSACIRQLSRIDSLRSQTIHSFCQSLLRAYPIEAGLDPQFKIIEGFERSLLYGQLYDAWLDEETRTSPTTEGLVEWEALLHHAGYLFLVRNMIMALLERRDLMLEEDYEVGDVRDVEDDLIAALESCVEDDRICRYIRGTAHPARGSSIDAWIEYLAPIAPDIRTTDLPKKKTPYKDALKFLRASSNDGKGSSIYDRLTAHRAGMAVHALTRRFINFLDAEKRKLGVVDFDDLLLRTVALLDDPVVLERVRRQFDYLFVDEFQDTDRTQARIIDRLARDSSGAYVPGKTVVVGDPKQSIYGFRRADPETYYRMTQALIDDGRGAECRVLEEQYRSDTPLVDAVNAMFARLFPATPHDPNVFRPAYNPLRAARTTPRRETEARITFLLSDADDARRRFAGEAESVAQWIAAHRDGGPHDLQRFALLFRRLTKIEDYLDTFDRLGIEYVLPPMRLFLDRRAPVDLLAVLRAIAWPFDRGAEISAARTPYFGLTDVEIVDGVPVPPRRGTSVAEANNDELAAAIADAGSERASAWKSFREALARYREAARHLTVSQLIDLIVESTAIERAYELTGDGQRSQRYLDHLRDIAFQYDRKIGGSVRQFVDEITRRRGEPDEMEPSLVDESRNAIRILSVHAAKGLEFETVILPDLDFPLNPAEVFAVEEPRMLVMNGAVQTLSSRYRRTADGQALREVGAEREAAEMRRLFYVGVTRAQSEVVFVFNPETAKKSGFMQCLHEAFSLDALPSGTGRQLREMAVGAVTIAVALERMPPAAEAVHERQRFHDTELGAQLVREELAAFDAPVPVREAALLTPAEAVVARAGEKNRDAGVLLHRLLERWDGVVPAEPLLRTLAAEAAADDETIGRVRKRLSVIQKSATFRRLAAAETIAREMPLHILEGGKVVTRRLDRLLRENGRELVVDYKSGKPEESRLSEDRAQVEAYCVAITAMTGRPCSGLLWYIDAERDAAVEVG
ncbi:MAG: UvrD-helicase domain-containing protein [Acidobacteriota bacterium]